MDYEEFRWALRDEASIPLFRIFYEKAMPLGVAHREKSPYLHQRQQERRQHHPFTCLHDSAAIAGNTIYFHSSKYFLPLHRQRMLTDIKDESVQLLSLGENVAVFSKQGRGQIFITCIGIHYALHHILV